MNSTIPSLGNARPFRLGVLLVEPPLRRLVREDGRIQVIEPKMMMVLLTLVEAQEQVVTREDLLRACWENRAVSDDAINRVISRLRALSLDIGEGCFQIETLSKVGYRLLAAPQNVSVEKTPFETPLAEAIPSEPARISRRALLFGIGSGTVALALGAGYAALRHTRRQETVPSVLVLLVLPFSTLSNDAVTPLFARSVTEALRGELGRVSGIQVIAAMSSQAIAQQQLSAGLIRQRTGADLLVDGSIATANERVNVSLSLTDTHTDQQVWSTFLSGSADNLLQLQNDVTAQVIQQIASKIHSNQPTTIGPTYHRDPEVYRLTLQAQELLENVRALRMTDQAEPAFDAADEADKLVRQSLKIDGNDPESLLVLAQLTRNGWTRTLAAQPLTTMQRATASLEYIRKALRSDAANPAALVSLGDYYRRFEWRWDDAEALFKRALAINQSMIEAHWSYGYQLGVLGNALEGLDHALTLFQLDPKNPWHSVALPRLLYLCGQYEGAMKRYDIEISAAPNNVFLLYEVYFTLFTKGDSSALQRYAFRLAGLWSGKTMPDGICALLKRIPAAVAALNGQPQGLITQLDADLVAFNAGGAAAATLHGRARDDLPYIFAMEYAWAGRFDQAITMLDKALAARSLYWPACLPYGSTPFPAQMRSDPRYESLWTRETRLADAIERRRVAVEARQMAGTLPDGRDVVPVLPSSLQYRIEKILGSSSL
ncbi:MAG: winged helix-turn-helix domain-containing protein [Acidobacteriaceae bacterium]|nr:winged helix-turn-helix domain-containing protein [Acidobacteriaceae bacterium]